MVAEEVQKCAAPAGSSEVWKAKVRLSSCPNPNPDWLGTCEQNITFTVCSPLCVAKAHTDADPMNCVAYYIMIY
jgi:hypothetical protein